MSATPGMRSALVAMSLAAVSIAGSVDVERAQEFYRRAEYRAAIDALLPLASKSPDGMDLLGRAYFMSGQYKMATDWLEKAVVADPSNAGYYDWLGRAYGRRAETSSFVTALSYASRTRENFEKAVTLDPVNLEALSDLFEYYLEAPRVLGGGMDKAEAIAARIGRLDAAEFEYKLAEIAEKRKQHQVAEQHFRRAVEIEPGQIGRVIDLGEFLASQRRYEECDELFRKAEAMSPTSPKLMFARARLQIQSGRNLNEAKKLLRTYLASPLTPDDPPRSEALVLAKMTVGR
jgi:tetratricopeptide (TPR) repeat protein